MRRSCRLRLSFAAVATLLALAAAAPALAAHATCATDPWAFREGGCGNFFSIGASVGQVAGSGSERVYHYPLGEKTLLSDLKWDFKDVTIAGVTASTGFGDRYIVNIGFWSAIRGGSGLMVDHDWLSSEPVAKAVAPDDGNWTHESRHPDTSLDGGTMLDLSVSFLALRVRPFSLRGMLGYKRDAWSWSARGGTYVYSEQEYRDSTGSFQPGVQVIEYKQTYSIPYLGVGANWTTRAFLADIHLLASPAVWASDTDYHNLRDITFKGDFFGGLYVGVGLTATWAISERWAATLGGEYQSITRLTGDETMITRDGTRVFQNGVGMGMNALLYSLGVNWRF